MDIVFVKAWSREDNDRTYLVENGVSTRAAVHVVHDLPHLVVESLFHIDDALWGELERGEHREANFASTARHTKRQKLGRIVTGAATGVATSEWLTQGHRRAKTITNCVANTFSPDPPSALDVRRQLAARGDASANAVLAQVDDATIELAIRGVAHLRRRWAALPPGQALRLTWPLSTEWLEDLDR